MIHSFLKRNVSQSEFSSLSFHFHWNFADFELFVPFSSLRSMQQAVKPSQLFGTRVYTQFFESSSTPTKISRHLRFSSTKTSVSSSCILRWNFARIRAIRGFVVGALVRRLCSAFSYSRPRPPSPLGDGLSMSKKITGK